MLYLLRMRHRASRGDKYAFTPSRVTVTLKGMSPVLHTVFALWLCISLNQSLNFLSTQLYITFDIYIGMLHGLVIVELLAFCHKLFAVTNENIVYYFLFVCSYAKVHIYIYIYRVSHKYHT